MDTTLSSAILGGITTSLNLSDVAAYCSTNDCRWPSYQTLAICSMVEDVSSQLVRQDNHTDSSEHSFYAENMNMTLPVPELYDTKLGNPTFPGPNNFWMATSPSWRANENSVRPNLIAETYVIYFSACRATNGEVGKPKTEELLAARSNLTNWRAMKSSFELCIQNITTLIVNGTTNTSMLERVDQQPWMIYDNNGVVSKNKTVFSDLMVMYSEIRNTTPGTLRPQFSVDITSMRALGDIMRLILNGSTTMRQADKKWKNSEQIILAQDVCSSDPEVCDAGPVNDTQGFQNRMQNIAVSLTNT